MPNGQQKPLVSEYPWLGDVSVRGSVLLMPMNEGGGDTVADQSGSLNNGTNNGAVWVAGEHEPALLFPDSGSVDVTIPSNAGLDLASGLVNGFTIHMDVAPDSGEGSFVQYINKSSSDWNASNGFSILHNIGSGDFRFYIDGTNVSTTVAGMAGKRFTFTCTLSSAYLATIYINGTFVYDQTISAPSISANPDILLGRDPGGSFPHNGLISSAVLFNYGLSASQVESLYDNPYQAWKQDNIALWAATQGGTPPVTGAIMNLIQKNNLGADLYNGSLICA